MSKDSTNLFLRHILLSTRTQEAQDLVATAVKLGTWKDHHMTKLLTMCFSRQNWVRALEAASASLTEGQALADVHYDALVGVCDGTGQSGRAWDVYRHMYREGVVPSAEVRRTLHRVARGHPERVKFLAEHLPQTKEEAAPK